VRLSRRHAVGAILLTTAALGGAGGCRSATSITLEVRTDLPCAGVPLNVGIAAARPGELDAHGYLATTSWCNRSSTHVGSLVLVPAEADDEDVAVRVVGAEGRDPATCTLADATGCIVVNLRLRYVPHENQNVSVELAAACVGVSCPSGSTCVEGGCRIVEPGASDADAGAGAADAGSDEGQDADAATGEDADREDTAPPPPTCPVVPNLVLCCGKLSCVGATCATANECATCAHKCTDPNQPLCCATNKLLPDHTYDVACKHVTDQCPAP